jgi:hypothetical protein
VSLGGTGAVSETPLDEQPARAAPFELCASGPRHGVGDADRFDLVGVHHRHPEFRREQRDNAGERRRRHAGHDVGQPAQRDGAADDRRIGAVLAPPHAIGEHDDAFGARSVVGGRQQPATLRLNAEHREVVAGHDLPERHA